MISGDIIYILVCHMWYALYGFSVDKGPSLYGPNACLRLHKVNLASKLKLSRIIELNQRTESKN